MKKRHIRRTLLGERTVLRQVSAILLSCLALCGLVLLSGCSQSSQSSQSSQPKQEQTSVHTITMDASWTRLYHDMKSLKQNADVIVRGTITRVAGTILPTKGPVMTDFTFTVTHVVWDPHQQVKNSNLIIHQTGGILNNTRYVISDDPLFQVGEQAVLFLHQYSSGHYYVIGGPTGRFVVQGGDVKPINDEGVQLAKPTSESAFYTIVQRA